MADSTVSVKVVPEIAQESLRDAVIEVITGLAVVGPGDTLVIRLRDWNPEQLDYYQRDLDSRDLPFKVLAVLGDELAVARREPDPVTVQFHVGDLDADAFTARVEKALAQLQRQQRVSGRG